MGSSARPADPGPRYVPGLALARRYQRRWLRDDVVAGLVLTALLVPAGMGYAQASGLDPVYGLYATVVPLLAYAVLGPSRIMVVGPDSALAPLIAAAVFRFGQGSPQQAATVASMLAILGGAIFLAAALARFGFLTDLVSKPVRYGYLNGIALVVVISQLPKLLGFSVPPGNAYRQLRSTVDGVRSGAVVGSALALGLAALVLILVARRLAPRLPAMLVAVVGAIVLVSALGLTGLPLVGTLPQGFPTPAWPGLGLSDITPLLGTAFAIALVSFADTSVLSRSMAIRNAQHVDPNQELLALGGANVASGLFQGFSISTSASRTPAAESAGAKTQVTGVVGAVSIVALLLAFPGAFRNLPTSVLAAIVIAAALTLVEVGGVVQLARTSRAELALSLLAFAGVALFGVLIGIGLAVAMSLLNFVRHEWRPHETALVRVDGLKGYHDVERHPEGHNVPGLLLYRFDAPLFFANAGYFREQVMRRIDENDQPVRWVVVTAEPVTEVDATAAEAIDELLDDLAGRHVVLAFAELKGVVRERMARYGLVDRIGLDHFYPTIGQAVRAYVAATGTTWVDWEHGDSDGDSGNGST